jgi:hypothetical protein
MSGSCGQLFVYVMSWPGRLVADAQLVQKKNCVSAARRLA